MTLHEHLNPPQKFVLSTSTEIPHPFKILIDYDCPAFFRGKVFFQKVFRVLFSNGVLTYRGSEEVPVDSLSDTGELVDVSIVKRI